ncbi:MAG: PBP1A family penicillin-binding protein [Alphaproteobacteria bacterium]|nr:PBP1A family penicillin-binding protein [Alphaproteobacteria bacterium]
MAKKKNPQKEIKTKNKKKTKTKKKRLWSLFFLKWFFILSIWCAIGLGFMLAYYAHDLPNLTQKANFERRSSIIIQASQGEEIARYGELKGTSIDIRNLPPHLIDAVLATEDRRFYEHPGVDLLGIARAMAVNIAKGRFAQGGSTITQQLAKNLFLTHDRKLKRKIQEAMLALWLEHELSKDEILSAYLNRVYLGAGVYGVEAASLVYFDKHVQDINLYEAAILAGLLKAPSRYSPSNNYELAKERAKVVLMAMEDAGYITKEERDIPFPNLSQPKQKVQNANSYRYFADWIMDGLPDLVGTPDMDLIVVTTMDIDLQKAAETELTKTLIENGETMQVTQGAVLSMRPDGAIVAMVGGRDYQQSQFNRTTQAIRSPGSAFKPILYLTALEQGMNPDDSILDAPIEEGDYRPKNFADQYFGTVTLETALGASMNTAAVRLMQQTGVGPVRKKARELGIISELENDLSLALGSSGVSMLEMEIAYASISNGGYRVYPYGIESITNTEGRILYQRKRPAQDYSVAQPRAISNLTNMMQTVVEEGTGRRAKIQGVRVAGKTGTSQENRDAWFIGFTDTLVTAVWLGNDDNSPMNGVTGGNLPASIWHNVMATNYNRFETIKFSASRGSQQDGSFSSLINSLISGGNNRQGTRKEGDFSNLND